MLPDSMDIAKYIAANYPSAEKIVEVGIGREDAVFLELKKNFKTVLFAVDIHPTGDSDFDDLFEPDRVKYQGANLIYSIRPNPELILVLRNIAQRTGSDLLIRPLSTDSCHKPKSMKLVNFGKTVFWVEKR